MSSRFEHPVQLILCSRLSRGWILALGCWLFLLGHDLIGLFRSQISIVVPFIWNLIIELPGDRLYLFSAFRDHDWSSQPKWCRQNVVPKLSLGHICLLFPMHRIYQTLRSPIIWSRSHLLAASTFLEFCLIFLIRHQLSEFSSKLAQEDCLILWSQNIRCTFQICVQSTRFPCWSLSIFLHDFYSKRDFLLSTHPILKKTRPIWDVLAHCKPWSIFDGQW